MRIFCIVLFGFIACAGCKRKAPAPTPTPAAPVEAPVDDRNTAPVAGGGALQNVRQAVRRTVTLAEFNALGVLILSYDLDNNKMPSTAEIKKLLEADFNMRKVLEAVNDGSIILTGTKTRMALWAYEIDANKAGGVVLYNNVASRATAEEVQALLAKL